MLLKPFTMLLILNIVIFTLTCLDCAKVYTGVIYGKCIGGILHSVLHFLCQTLQCLNALNRVLLFSMTTNKYIELNT